MEIHQSAVILLLIFSVSSFTHGEIPENIKPRYENFLNQHFGPDMTVKNCDSVIKKRGIIRGGTENGCKEINSFINANSKDIRAVCEKAGTPQGGDLFKSNQPFPVITCKLKSGEKHQKCEYRGVSDTRYIVLGCDHGWPVHYDEGIYKPNNV
ncbi:ribonuclease-like 3 [Chanodichthys erythropterus]|uniref:ribonuclease-like 3 n=1 Tax=Chanodichthys erythropterus TaxID=933992 RepID=UPI00351DB88D